MSLFWVKKIMNRCSNCGVQRPSQDFIGKRGGIVKKCLRCRQSGECPCGKRRDECIKCGGGSRCPCGNLRRLCIKCDGASLCPCKRVRSSCKKCGGGSYCPCNKLRSRCLQHGGGSLCICGKRRGRCKVCPKGDGPELAPADDFNFELDLSQLLSLQLLDYTLIENF